MDPENTADSGFDISAGVDDIAGSLGFDASPDDKSIEDVVADDVEAPAEGSESEPVAVAPEAKPEAPAVRPPPQSWSKDMHEVWSQLPPKAQEYYELREKQMLDGLEQYKEGAAAAKQYREILTPYKPMLQAQGVTETQAVQYLMNAHYRLTNGTVEERQAAYAQIGRDLGVVQADPNAAPEAQLPPEVRVLQQRLNQLESATLQERQAKETALRDSLNAEVEAFASDPAHPYFNDVQQDMLLLINGGLGLKDAYERAVWANPITRAKEVARVQTEAEAKAKETARLNGLKARQGTSTNIRARETPRAPTEPKGKMFDDMPDMLADIKKRFS